MNYLTNIIDVNSKGVSLFIKKVTNKAGEITIFHTFFAPFANISTVSKLQKKKKIKYKNSIMR